MTEAGTTKIRSLRNVTETLWAAPVSMLCSLTPNVYTDGFVDDWNAKERVSYAEPAPIPGIGYQAVTASGTGLSIW